MEFVIETSNDIEEGVSSGSLVTTADPVSLVAAGAKGTWKKPEISNKKPLPRQSFLGRRSIEIL